MAAGLLLSPDQSIYLFMNIWKEHNRRVFDNPINNADQVFFWIKQEVTIASARITGSTFGENEPEPEPD